MMLSREEIRRLAPSVFDSGPANSVSEQYSFVSTETILNILDGMGWNCIKAKQVKSKLSHRKHHLTFANDSIDPFIDPRGNNVPNGQITLELFNSSDGKFAFRFYLGIITFICENGLISGNVSDSARIPHIGIRENEIQNELIDTLNNVSRLQERANRMSHTELTDNDINWLAKNAYSIKYNVEDPINSQKLLTPRRKEDNGKDLWTVFNVIQENLMRGGFRNSNGRLARGIQSIDKTEKINTTLWTTAYSLIEESYN